MFTVIFSNGFSKRILMSPLYFSISQLLLINVSSFISVQKILSIDDDLAKIKTLLHSFFTNDELIIPYENIMP